MDIPREEGLNVISPPRITNIPSASATMTVGLEEDKPAIPEARLIGPWIEVEPVPSINVPSQPTNLLPSSIKSKLINADLERIGTIYGILDEYQLRVANKKERMDWRSPGWVCYYEVAFVACFRFSFPKLVREFFAHFGISPSQVLPNVWRTLLALLVLSKI